MSNSNSGCSGIGFGTILFIVLLILKLLGIINISWWAVILIPVGIGIVSWVLLFILLYLIVNNTKK